MRLVEVIESATMTKIPLSFWINGRTGEIFRAEKEHIEEIEINPEKFGIDQNTVKEIRSAFSGFERDYWGALMKEVAKNGWVRGGKQYSRDYANVVFLQGDTDRDIWRAARKLAEIEYFDALYIDNTFEFFQVSLSTFTFLHNDDLEFWLKRGKVPPPRRTRRRFDF